MSITQPLFKNTMKANTLCFAGLLAVSSGAFLFLNTGTATAATVSTNANDGTIQTTTGLTGFTTNGDNMVGTAVTAFFSGGGSQTLSWAATGAGAGGVTGTGWSLVQSGDTFTQPWTLTVDQGITLTGFSLNGIPGNTVFDRTTPSPGTDGSAQGLDFAFVSSSALLATDTIDVTYSNALSIGAAAPVGDLYTFLNVSFANNPLSGGTLVYLQDADNASTEIVIRDTPEPASMVGLLGLGAIATISKLKRKH
jgi:hypothetical protein